jgi:competence protein ComEA
LLVTLPGIGPATARAILAHRAAHGPFKSVDDVIAVRGIGPKKLEDLRPHVRVGGTPASADSEASPHQAAP